MDFFYFIFHAHKKCLRRPTFLVRKVGQRTFIKKKMESSQMYGFWTFRDAIPLKNFLFIWIKWIMGAVLARAVPNTVEFIFLPITRRRF
jgi:hypothetical protein